MNSPLSHEASIASNRRFFNEMAASWDERCIVHEEQLRQVLHLFSFPKDARFLDVACGTAVLAPFLLELAPSQIRGLDLSEAMIAEARKKYPAEPRLEFAVGDFYEEEGEGYDALFLYNAYPHFADKEGFFRKAHELLRPGGRLLLFHGTGRQEINRHHEGLDPSLHPHSVPLEAAREEGERMRGFFALDAQLDLPQLYLLSGTRI